MAELDVQSIPKPWRNASSLLKFVAWVLASAGVALGVVHGEASRVVEEKWNDRQRAEVVAIAAEAARSGAAAAISDQFRELFVPLQTQVTALTRTTEERYVADQRRLSALEDRADRLEQALFALPAERRRKGSLGNP